MMLKMLKAATLCVFVFITGCNQGVKEKVSAEIEADNYSHKIDSLIQTTHPRFFNGVILITKGEERKYFRASGFSNFEKKEPISLKNRFRIMSNTKQITAVLILKEVEKGKIRLQDPIKTYLPTLQQSWADSVTIHQLLNMSSGIADLEEPLLFVPGEGYYYSNPGYGLLGMIINQVTGRTFSDNAKKLFEELDMDDTYCYELDGGNQGLIESYALKTDEVEKVDFERFGFTVDRWSDFILAGGVVSTVEDLNKWDRKLHRGEILSRPLYQEMVSSSNYGPHAVFGNDTVGYGYGLRIDKQRGVDYLGHGGRGFGFVSVKLFFPASDVSLIVWENIYHMDGFPDNADVIYHFENQIRKIVVESTLVD